jgi:hypothetical protein
MFRWERTACHTPCPAKEKLRQNPDRGAVQERPVPSSPCPGGLILITFVSSLQAGRQVVATASEDPSFL